jgi:hypothetical protein
MKWREHMPIMADVMQEKQRVSDQLTKIDAERAKLLDRLNELEIAERVLSRFGKQRGDTPRRGRPSGRPSAPQSKPAGANGESPGVSARRQRAARPAAKAVPLGEATLRAVQAHSGGVSAEAVRDYIAKQFGLTVRPNHLGMALQRLRRAGRLEIRDSGWHALQ